MSDSLRPHESQHTRPPCPTTTPWIHSDSRPSSQWCHPDISSSVAPVSSCPQSLPASNSFPMSQLFAWGGQSTGVQWTFIVQLLSHVQLFTTPWTAACQASLSFTIFLELAQTHVHWVGDAIQPSYPLFSPSPALSLSQHQGLFQFVGGWKFLAISLLCALYLYVMKLSIWSFFPKIHVLAAGLS